jgi:hypothetical protein
MKTELLTCLRGSPRSQHRYWLLDFSLHAPFTLAYKNCPAINILFYTFEFDLGHWPQPAIHPLAFCCAVRKSEKNMRIKPMKRTSMGLLQMMHFGDEAKGPLMKWKELRVWRWKWEIDDICVKSLTTTEKSLLALNLLSFVRAHRGEGWTEVKGGGWASIKRVGEWSSVKSPSNENIFHRTTTVDWQMENLFIVIVIMNCLSCCDHLREGPKRTTSVI